MLVDTEKTIPNGVGRIQNYKVTARRCGERETWRETIELYQNKVPNTERRIREGSKVREDGDDAKQDCKNM